MASIEAFSPDELRLIQHAPVYVIAGAAASGETGLTGSLVEVIEGVEDFAASMASAGDSLLTSIFQAIDQTQPDDFDISQVSDPHKRDEIVARGLRTAADARALLAERASPDDVNVYAAALIHAARAAAKAASTGGILGFGSVEVSVDEAEYIRNLAEALGVPLVRPDQDA